ncbi:MAG: hypothetical protein KGP12_02985 [Actinomycetales bacterium]|nr:hypothetical protein [Actinomycetales bacterium]
MGALVLGPLVLAGPATASPQPGGSCKKAGDTYTVRGRGTLTCKKVKGKLVWTAPSGDGSSGSASAASCKPPKGLTRSASVPFGTRAPAFLVSPKNHSYGSAAAIKAKGFNAINTSILIPYNSAGDLDFSREGGKAAWLCRLGQSLGDLKKAGLVVLVEGEVQAVDNPQGTEPGPVPDAIRAKVAQGISGLMPDLAKLMEQYKVEYFAPLGESEKWLGVDLTQANYPQWAATAKQTYKGKVFAQLFTGVPGQQAFGPLGLTPNLSNLDALGIVFGDWNCSANSLAYTDAYVQAARSQGVGTILASELGGTTKPQNAAAAQACMQQVVDRYGTRQTGVLFMDNDQKMPGSQSVEGQWPETFVLSLR